MAGVEGAGFLGQRKKSRERARGEKASPLSFACFPHAACNYDLLYDSLWQELSKVPGGYYLEKDFWYHKIPKYIARFWKSTPPAKVLANSQ